MIDTHISQEIREKLIASPKPTIAYTITENTIRVLLFSDSFSQRLGLSKAETSDLLSKDGFFYLEGEDKLVIERNLMQVGKNRLPMASMFKNQRSTFRLEASVLEGVQDVVIVSFDNRSISQFDELTGLATLPTFLEHAEKYRRESFSRHVRCALLAFDFNGMKAFNMKHGIGEGDEALRRLAKALSLVFGFANVSRLGEDHFYAICESSGVEKKVNQVFDAFHEASGDKVLPINCGIFVCDNQDLPIAACGERDKMAADTKKDSFVDQMVYFDNDIAKQIEEKNYILSYLDEALEKHWIQCYYQPIARGITGKICDEEALTRWQDPVRGLLQPDRFIPVLEEAHLIYKVDLYIVDRILEDFAVKASHGIENVPVSVNLSRHDFAAVDMVEEIRRRVVRSGFSPKLLTIEITESVSGTDPDFLKAQITRFHKAGFDVWMDDFGSGYSSLNVLQEFDFDLIKLDMKFMKDFNSNGKSRPIITEIIQMAEKLGIDTLCEGVETKEQLDFLRSIGCDKIQGYYYSKPSPMAYILSRQSGFIRESFDSYGYYQTLSKASLSSSKANGDSGTQVDGFLSETPVGILEYDHRNYYLLRSNGAFSNYLRQETYVNFETENTFRIPFIRQVLPAFSDAVERCLNSGNWESCQVPRSDGSRFYIFVRKLSTDPVTQYSGILTVFSSFDWAKISKATASETDFIKESYFIPDFYHDLSEPILIAKVVRDRTGEPTDLEMMYCNERFCTLAGAARNQIVGTGYLRTFPNGDTFWRDIALQALDANGDITFSRQGIITGHFLNGKVSPISVADSVIFIFNNIDRITKGKETVIRPWSATDSMVRIMRILNSEENFRSMTDHILKEISSCVSADRILLLVRNGKNFTCQSEWTRKSIPSIKNSLPRLSYDRYGPDMERYLKFDTSVVFRDTDVLKDAKPEFYQLIKPFGGRRMIATPVYDEGEIIAYLIVANYALDEEDSTKHLLETISGLFAPKASKYLVRRHKPLTRKMKAKKKETVREESRNAFRKLLHFLAWDKKNTAEAAYFDEVNIRMLTWTSLVMVIFLIISAMIFNRFFVKPESIQMAPELYYPWDATRNWARLIYAVISLSVFIFCLLLNKGHLKRVRHVRTITHVALDFYIIVSNGFGALMSALNYQVGNQVMLYILMLCYTAMVFRIYPLRSFFYQALSVSFFLVAIRYINMFPGVTGLHAAFDSDFLTNLFAIFALVAVVNQLFYMNTRKNAVRVVMDKRFAIKNNAALEADAPLYYNTPVTMVFLSVKNFKHFNEAFGLAMGDTILQGLAQAIKDNFGSESLYRYSNNKFLIISEDEPDEIAQGLNSCVRFFIPISVLISTSASPHVSAAVSSTTPTALMRAFPPWTDFLPKQEPPNPMKSSAKTLFYSHR